MKFKTCPKCNDEVGGWRPRCPCGHVFYVERETTVVPRDEAGELDDLIANIEGRPTKARPARKPKRVRERIYYDNGTSSALAPRITARPEPSRTNYSGLAKLVLSLVLGLVAVVIAFEAIADYPLQVIAAMLVLLVLFGVVIRVRHE